MAQKKILIVSRDISQKQDGGTLVSKRNERLFKEMGFETERFIIGIPSIATRLRNIIFRESYGETPELRKAFKKKLQENFDFIFFDSSIYGGFLKTAAESGAECWCFYHNIEAEYYRLKAKVTKSFADRLMVGYIRHNERLSSKYSTTRIVLNNRDAAGLSENYNVQADLILPTSFPKIKRHQAEPVKNPSRYILFVGTNFFANKEGLEHYLQEIAPHVKIKTVIVGNINEAFRNFEFDPEKIQFEGRVDNLEPYYAGASAVIAPILSGSGLKTKTAEALSYGKTVIGYPEAFEGIPLSGYEDGCICVDTPVKFISAINNLDTTALLNATSVSLFENELSDERQIEKLSSYIHSDH